MFQVSPSHSTTNKPTHPIGRSHDNNLKGRIINRIKALNITFWIFSFLEDQKNSTIRRKSNVQEQILLALQICPSGHIYPFGDDDVLPSDNWMYPDLLRVFGSICPPQKWPSSFISSSPRTGDRKHVRLKDPLNE
jgi:hypothetical protein